MIPTGKVAKSMWLRANHPANKSSKTKRASICNYGINDADYVVNPKINGTRQPCPAYATWRDMVQRCVDVDYKKKHPAYAGASVWAGWQRFMAFRRWWLDNYVEGWEMDKDLLSGAYKIYSPATCIFIPQWLNLFIKEPVTPSRLPKGVFYEESRGKYKATLKHLNTTMNLGRYRSVAEARDAFVEAKIAVTQSRRWEIESIQDGLFDRVISAIKEGC